MIRPPCGVCVAHQPERGRGDQERPVEVDREHLAPVLPAHVAGERRRNIGAGVVEDHVEPAVSSPDPREERLDRAGSVTSQATGSAAPPLPASPAATASSLPASPRGQHHRIAGAGEGPRGGGADALARAGDEDDLAVGHGVPPAGLCRHSRSGIAAAHKRRRPGERALAEPDVEPARADDRRRRRCTQTSGGWAKISQLEAVM